MVILVLPVFSVFAAVGIMLQVASVEPYSKEVALASCIILYNDLMSYVTKSLVLLSVVPADI